jgi:hypothetical protein
MHRSRIKRPPWMWRYLHDLHEDERRYLPVQGERASCLRACVDCPALCALIGQSGVQLLGKVQLVRIQRELRSCPLGIAVGAGWEIRRRRQQQQRQQPAQAPCHRPKTTEGPGAVKADAGATTGGSPLR